MHLVDTTLFYSPTSGGIRRYLGAKHDWLIANSAHRHSLLVPGESSRLEVGGISTVAAPKLPGAFNYRLPLWPPSWTRLLDALQPDLIEAGDVFQPAWSTLKVARRRAVPAVAFFHSNLAPLVGERLGSVAGRLMQRYSRSIYARFDLVLAPSLVMCEYLQQLGLRRVVHQPLGVDTQIFSPARGTLDLRRQLQLPQDTRLLIFPGRFSEEKNLPLLYEAMALLGKPYHLLLVGGDRTLRPSERISVLPYRRDATELASWIASADALVHAGASETFGLVIIEALACGRPVVGVRAGAVPELIDETVGELAVAGRADSLEQAIRRLFERDLQTLGANARQRALQRYTWDRVLRGQLDLYESLLGRGGRAASGARPDAPAAPLNAPTNNP